MRLSADSVALTVDAPLESETVELMGSFTDWFPLRLERAGTVWTITVRATPGVHRLKVRVDGGDWRVPSNLTVSRDEYGAAVGTIILR